MHKRKFLTVFIIILIFVFGLLSTIFLWKITAIRLSQEALEQACIVANSINLNQLENLNGDSTDLNSPEYIRIKEQLKKIRENHKTCRFLYIMGQENDKTVFFFIDSQSKDSEDYAPPGLIYDEVSDQYLYSFKTGKQVTVGPITDRWGTLVTSLVPLYSNKTNKLIAVLGMDVDAKDWNRKILSQCIIPISLTILTILLIFILYVIYRNRQLLKIQNEEKNKVVIKLQETLQHVKTLHGLLPICSSCKKIRLEKADPKNEKSWVDLENYLKNKTEIEFSHSICPKCLKKLYPEFKEK